MSLIHIGRTLTFKREGNVIHGYAAVIDAANLYDGSEHFMLVARSKASLARKLRDSFPEMEISPKAFLEVTITLE